MGNYETLIIDVSCKILTKGVGSPQEYKRVKRLLIVYVLLQGGGL